MDNRKILPIVVILLIGIIVIVSLSSSIFFTIQPGEAAVVFEKFGDGLDKENILNEGFHMKAPWNSIYRYEIRENKIEEPIDVRDKNNLNINMDVTARFRPKPDRIGYLHERFGEGYVERLVIPEVRSTVRRVIGQYSAEEIISTKRAEIENAIATETKSVLGNEDNNIEVVALLFRSIKLPDQINKAIEAKLQQEQEALAYQFRLEKEKSEAERKRIAAEGEAQANAIINSSLTDELLKMRGIEATRDLANSQNTKVVIVGNSKDGLPIILGDN